MRNAVIYARVSTIEQDYERQINELNRYCEYEKFKIVQTFSEKQSGTIEVRDELNNMLGFVENKNNDIKYVVVHELSRLGRTSEVIRTIEKLNKLQICLVSLKENIKTLNEDLTVNHSASLILSILSSINSFELTTMKFRSISGMLNSARNGNSRGWVQPYGYKKDEGGIKLVIDEEEAVVVRKMFEMYISGQGSRKIVNYLNENNIPTKFNKLESKEINYNKVGIKKDTSQFKWIDTTVQSILKNPIYKGERLYKGETVKAPAILEPEIFDKVQEIMKSNFMKQGINRKYSYLFENGKIKCGICGKSYYIETRKDTKASIYKCMSIRYNDNCGNYCINYDKLNRGIFSIFNNQFHLKDELLKSLNDTENQNNKLRALESDIKSLEGQLNELDKGEEKLLDLAIGAGLSKKLFKKKMDEIKERKSGILKTKALKLEEKASLSDFIEKQKSIIENISIFEDAELFKDSINQNVQKIVLYPISNDIVFKKSKLDRFLYVELYTYIKPEPFTFTVSQRTSEYPLLWPDLFDKDTLTYDSDKMLERDSFNINKLSKSIGF